MIGTSHKTAVQSDGQSVRKLPRIHDHTCDLKLALINTAVSSKLHVRIQMTCWSPTSAMKETPWGVLLF